MKATIFLLLIMLFSPVFAPEDYSQLILRPDPISYYGSAEDCLKAIIQVESGTTGNNTYNSNEPQAVGILQQWPIFVDDCNAIAGYAKYTYDDRLIPDKAIEMFWEYQEFYNPTLNIEKMARIQAGGPDGDVQECTLPYLELVKRQLINRLIKI